MKALIYWDQEEMRRLFRVLGDRLGHANIQNTQRYLRYTTATRDAQTRRLFSSPHVV